MILLCNVYIQVRASRKNSLQSHLTFTKLSSREWCVSLINALSIRIQDSEEFLKKEVFSDASDI